MSYRSTKKLCDLTLSIILLFLFSPVIIIISFIVSLETGRAPFFFQDRGLTLTNKRFKIYKFRTFKSEPERLPSKGQSFLLKRNEEELITLFGRFLRKTGLDELPQLFNIIKGEMSFIGPRPLALTDLQIMKQYYPSIYSKRESDDIMPGLSGLWQLNKGEDYSIRKLGKLEEIYLRKRSLSFDALLFAKSILIILSAKHNDAVIKEIFKSRPVSYAGLKTDYLIGLVIAFIGLF